PQGSGRPPVRTVIVTAVLVVQNGAAWLKECLDALALQTRPPDRLVIVDTGSTDDSVRITEKHARIRQVVGNVTAISAPPDSTFGEAVARAVDQLLSDSPSEPGSGSPTEPASGSTSSQAAMADSDAGWLWLLHDDSAAAPHAPAQLLDP